MAELFSGQQLIFRVEFLFCGNIADVVASGVRFLIFSVGIAADQKTLRDRA
jgi:hypothetical protein